MLTVTARTLSKTPIQISTPSAVQFQSQGKHICQNFLRTWQTRGRCISEVPIIPLRSYD